MKNILSLTAVLFFLIIAIATSPPEYNLKMEAELDEGGQQLILKNNDGFDYDNVYLDLRTQLIEDSIVTDSVVYFSLELLELTSESTAILDLIDFERDSIPWTLNHKPINIHIYTSTKEGDGYFDQSFE